MGRTGTKCALDIVGVPHIFSATKAYIYIYIYNVDIRHHCLASHINKCLISILLPPFLILLMYNLCSVSLLFPLSAVFLPKLMKSLLPSTSPLSLPSPDPPPLVLHLPHLILQRGIQVIEG